MRPRLRPRMTLRTRVTALASLGITAAIVGGLLLLYQLQASSVRATIDDQLRTYATEVAQSAPDGQWSGPLPASTLDANAEAQVITADGQVLAATRTLTGLPAIYQLPASATSPVRQVAAEGVVPTDIRVVAQRFTVAGQQVTIVTGTGTALLETVDTEFLRLLLLGLPLILLLSAFAVWIVVGRSLGPVDRIRHAVEAITADDLSRRVPEPQTTDEIGQLARTMNAMLRRLDDSARTTLEVGLAHPETAPWPTIAHRAAQQSQRLEALIQQLLLLASTEDHPPSAPHDRVDVDVGTLLDRLHHDLSPTQPQLTLHIGDNGVVTGDPDGLTRMLRNIVDNAIRHARHSVQIHTTTTHATITITIDDDGPGVPPADRDRIFNRFVRLDNSRERGTGGSGLGLAITHQIADAHHATITVSNSPHGGARFTVQLPLTLHDTTENRSVEIVS
jgi:signal transduction histidine kinase